MTKFLSDSDLSHQISCLQVRTVVSEVPEESCDIVPSKVCKSVAQLVPHLSPVEKCSDLPREICSFGLKSPKITEKPLITKWCFDPAEGADISWIGSKLDDLIGDPSRMGCWLTTVTPAAEA